MKTDNMSLSQSEARALIKYAARKDLEDKEKAEVLDFKPQSDFAELFRGGVRSEPAQPDPADSC